MGCLLQVKSQPCSIGTSHRTLLILEAEKLTPGNGGPPACHTHQLAIIEEGEPDGLKVEADLVLSWRLGGEGETALRAVLPGQEVLGEAASSEHREVSRVAAFRRILGVSQVQTPTGQRAGYAGHGIGLAGKSQIPALLIQNTKLQRPRSSLS